jgi:hypothetical protein
MAESLENQLFSASKNGDWESVKVLLDRGADPNTAIDGYTVLMVASQEGHLEVVKVLLDRGADINTETTYTSFTALDLTNAALIQLTKSDSSAATDHQTKMAPTRTRLWAMVPPRCGVQSPTVTVRWRMSCSKKAHTRIDHMGWCTTLLTLDMHLASCSPH